MRANVTTTRLLGTCVAMVSVVLAAGAGLLAGSGRGSAGLVVGGLAIACSAFALHRLTRPTADGVVPAWERVRTEIERARRLNSSLVVARLSLRPSVTGEARSIADQAEFVLRGSDSVWFEGNSILLLLTEADRESAQHGIDRVLRRLDGAVAESRAAAFPGDELTVGALVDRLYPPRRVRALSARGGQAASVAVFTVDGDHQATA